MGAFAFNSPSWIFGGEVVVGEGNAVVRARSSGDSSREVLIIWWNFLRVLCECHNSMWGRSHLDAHVTAANFTSV